MGRFLGGVASLALLAAVAAYIGSPFFAFHQLREAAQVGDRERIEALVDDKAVREGMKSQVDNEFTRAFRAASGIAFGPVQAAGKAGSTLGDRKIKHMVAPETLSAMLTKGEAPARGERHDVGEASAPVSTNYDYLSPDRFRAQVHRQGLAPIGFVMERKSLFGWKLVKVEIKPAR